MVDSVSASPDGRQVTFKLKEPFGLFIERLASFQDFWVVPREIAGTPQANTTMVGSGPFILESYERGVAWKFRKNPDYFERDQYGNQLPYVDALEYPILGDSNAILSQFAAGNLATAGVPSDLVDSVLSQTPNAKISQFLRSTLSMLFFSPNEDTWKDERVRRALSMAIDRDALNQAMSRDGGEWANIVSAGMGTRWWLDPKSSEMGDAGKWYRHNVEEAKRLLSEAGHGGGLRVPMHYSANVYSTVVRYYDPTAQALPAMFKDIGVEVEQVAEDYIGQYFPNTFLKGPSNGFAWGLESTYSDVAQYMTNMYLPRNQGGGRNHSNIQDEALVSMVRNLIQEQDSEEFQKKLFDIERYVSDKMYIVPVITPWEYTARQPWLKGAVNVSGPTTYAVGTESTMWVWLDR
jgi:peptide/nickel transport system substrate-binding protein